MLLRFRFSNFRSFRDEQELSFVASGSLRDVGSLTIPAPSIDESILTAAAIYGANASGKTNVLRALLFVASAVAHSHSHWQPSRPIKHEPFITGTKSTAPSLFELDFLIAGIRYCYGFRLTAAAIVEEWLRVYPKGRKQTWFHRRHGKRLAFSSKMAGPNRAIEALTRKNSLFLSAAAQNNHEALMPVHRWLSSLRFVADAMAGKDAYSTFTAELCAKPSFARAVERLIRSADLGIEGMRVERVKAPSDVRRALTSIASALKIEPPPPDLVKTRIRLIHRFGKESVALNEDEESTGTIAYLRVLGPIVAALEVGAVLCIDELESSLHPLLASQLVRMFGDKSTNRKGAQLIFNTHDTNLLNVAGLRRDQIWFTEKDRDGTSRLYPLTDYKPRVNEKLENGYLQGRYGAIPYLDTRSFLQRSRLK